MAGRCEIATEVLMLFHRCSCSFAIVALGLTPILGCSTQPATMPPGASDTSTSTSSEVQTDESDLPNHTNGSESQEDTATEDSGAASASESVTESVTESASTTVQDSESVTQDSDTIVYCPYLCQDDIGVETCSTLGEHWVRHAGFLCEDPAQLCCQAIGQPGGVSGSCAEQPALSCRNGCGSAMIQRTDYYCPDATKICCEDPAGPTCTEMAGKCVTFLENCPAGYSNSNLDCGSFIEKCCAPPICPWTCTAYNGDKTCSSKTTNPTAIRNDQYACPVKGDICCQPVDAPEGITESCADQARMVCRETCETYEKANDEFYCPLASRACCEDVRPKCIDDLSGQCVLPLVGCPDGMEKSARGLCLGSQTMDCCVNASPLNQCADQGGTCVGLGKMCPLLHTMDFATWCGNLTDVCCKPLL